MKEKKENEIKMLEDGNQPTVVNLEAETNCLMCGIDAPHK